MSRLDSFIRRMQAQSTCLALARELVSQLDGPVFELGLGNGRTYDHLRELFPGRDIYVFEMEITAHPDCIPDDDHLFLGDFLQCLPEVGPRFDGQVALIHADCGSGRPDRDEAVVAQLTKILPAFLAPGGVVVSDADLELEGSEPIRLPEGVAPGRYFIRRQRYRVEG